MSDTRYERRGFGLGVLFYQQVSSVIGALAFIALLSHVFDLTWHGFLAVALGAWTEYVRPAIKAVFYVAVTLPVHFLFNTTVEVPPLIREYLSVGLVLFTSAVRVDIFTRTQILGLSTVPSDFTVSVPSLGRLSWWYVSYALIYMLAWPFVVATAVVKLLSLPSYVRIGRDGTSWHVAWLLTLSPLLYFFVLLIANYTLAAGS